MQKKAKELKDIVKAGYAKIAKNGGNCCSSGSCCNSNNLTQNISKSIGYSSEDLNAVPEGANLGLGCGNPVALAALKKGDVVLDLGSGAGFDAFLAAQRVGKEGFVIGVDMTPEMLEKAKANAKRGGYTNVEFRLGEIEKLPVEDNSIDVIISNCVINLSPDKQTVFKEAFRVLKNDGRIMVSDLVLRKELPDVIKESIEAYIGCLSGAVLKEQYLRYIKEAGFSQIKVIDETLFPLDDMAHDATAKAVKDNPQMNLDNVREVANSVVSIKISALKRGK